MISTYPVTDFDFRVFIVFVWIRILTQSYSCVAAGDLGYDTFEFEHAIDSDAIVMIRS